MPLRSHQRHQTGDYQDQSPQKRPRQPKSRQYNRAIVFEQAKARDKIPMAGTVLVPGIGKIIAIAMRATAPLSALTDTLRPTAVGSAFPDDTTRVRPPATPPPKPSGRSGTASGSQGLGRPTNHCSARINTTTPNGVEYPGAGMGKADGNDSNTNNSPKARSPAVGNTCPGSSPTVSSCKSAESLAIFFAVC